MEEAYLVIKCVYEGIEDLNYLTESKDDAIDKINSLKNDIIKAKLHKEQVLKDAGILTKEDLEKYKTEHKYEDPWDELDTAEEITFDEYSKGKWGDPDDYCVRKWDGKEFKCCCQELGVPPSEPKLY
jgi:hypothetical protein